MSPENGCRVYPMPTGGERSWIDQARTIDAFLCDAAFHIQTSFYIGPETGTGTADWDDVNIRLPTLDLPRQRTEWITTAELLGHEDALVSHYCGIVRIAETHGKAASLAPFPYFRTQPVIIADAQVLTDFSWNDDVSETLTILEILAAAADSSVGLLHDDQDQGWHILIEATGAATCLIEWSEDGPPPAIGGYAFDAVTLARQSDAARERLGIIHGRLVEAMGRDYWTYHRPPTSPPSRPVTGLGAALRRIIRWPRTAEQWITREQAMLIIDAEVTRRGWSSFDQRTYNRVRADDGVRWQCHGFVTGVRGGVMLIEIDARTGALLRASAGGR